MFSAGKRISRLWGAFFRKMGEHDNRKTASLEKGDSPRGGEMPAGQRGPLSTRGTSEAGGGVHLQSVTSSAAVSKPSGGVRSLHSLSACGLPTPVVVLACIGNVDIQGLSGAGG